MQNANFVLPENPTVSEFAALFLRDYSSNKDSVKDDFRRINKKILPVLGHLRLQDVRRVHVSRLHKSMTGTPYEGNRTLELVQRMFEVAIEWEILPEVHGNPSRKIDRHPEYPRDVWVKQHEMPRVLEEIHNLTNNVYRVAILMLLATGCRQDELFAIEWKDVDFKGKQIHIRRKNTKTQQAHVVPITPFIEGYLQTLRRTSPFVFPGRNSASGHLESLGDTWRSLRKRAGIGEVQLRDLRSTAASWCANDNVSLYTIQKMLNHTTPRCTQRYAKMQNQPVRIALERYHENLNNPA